MPNLSNKIEFIVRGNNYTHRVTVSNIPEGDGLTQAYLTVKEEFWDTDEAALFQKSVVALNSIGQGQIEDTGSASGIAIIRFDFLPVDTVKLHEFFSYVYDVKYITVSGKAETEEMGTIITKPRVTRIGEPV
jgi:hypothetical protein